jgi:hypothetical protein
MAGLEPATRPARVGALKRVWPPADADAMDGRVEPAHDVIGM